MKKKVLKGIKKLSKSLPESKELVLMGVGILGSEISQEEIDNTDLEIEPEKIYKQRKHTLIDINHFNRMKSAYKRNKEQGLIEYINWLDNNNKKLNHMFEQLELQRVDAKLMNQIKKGAKGFWSNILMFLASFIMAFKNQKAA